jgi:OmpA-OmpF porin, OOP family
MQKLSYFAALLLIATTVPGHAQVLDENEILSLFQAQREAFTELRDEGTVKTRGLTLVTVDDVEPPSMTEIETPDSPLVGAELAPLNPATDTVVAQTAPLSPLVPQTETAVTFGRLDPDLQVNLFVKFAFDSAAIEDDQKPTLDRMCTVMRDSDIGMFQIVGHTDTSGSDDYNERLSRLRAEEVARYLVGSCGIEANRLTTLGLGERFPINETNPRADENRRVEFQALS